MHVERDDCRAKFWLDPVRFHDSYGFRAVELRGIHAIIEAHATQLQKDGMTSSPSDVRTAVARSVRVVDETLVVDLADGRSIVAPLAWYPRLQHADARERAEWRLIAKGEGVHWPLLDEDISVEGLLAGRPSGETQASLHRWLESRSSHA